MTGTIQNVATETVSPTGLNKQSLLFYALRPVEQFTTLVCSALRLKSSESLVDITQVLKYLSYYFNKLISSYLFQ